MKRVDQEPDPKLVRRLGIKLAVALLVLSSVAILSMLPEFRNAQANTAKAPKGPRTVIVLGSTDKPMSDAVRIRQCRAGLQCQNGLGGIAVVVLKSGKGLTHPMKAVVETDTNCDPDANGISHCSNRLRLSDGQSIEVRHDHNMRTSPCLVPGETVDVRPQRTSS